MLRLSGTAIARHGRALLLRGPSGAGKSSLALAAIAAGWSLVADDVVEAAATPAGIRLSPPAGLTGLIEVRGLGLIRHPCRAEALLAALIDLQPAANQDRLPTATAETLLNVSLPRHQIDPNAADAVMRLDLLLNLRRAA